MSKALTEAIIKRARGTDSATGDAAEAQVTLVSLLAQTDMGNPAFRQGAKGRSALYPEVTFREDAGVEAMGGVDVGIITHSVYRMEIWEQTRGGLLIPTIADCLELLFDCRRRAPVLTLSGDNQCWWGQVFVPLQGPFHNDNYDAFFGQIAFRFVEARP